jgi:histidinol-phosphate aminotransferase
MLRKTIRLHMNEAPYPPAQDVIEAARKGLSNLNRYADPEELERLRGLLAGYCGVPKHHVVPSPGSDLLLREVIHTFSKGRKVITVSPSFFPTVQAVQRIAAERLSIRLSPPAFDLNLELLRNALEGPSLVIIDNPNNPTGRMLLDRWGIEAILEHGNALLVIDEAYHEFSGVTFADMVADHPQLTIIRTMDKAFSLAGARVGYGIAGEACLDALSSFCAFLPQPSLYAATEALRHLNYMRENVDRVVEEREQLWQILDELGVGVYPSSTNFLLAQAEIPDLVIRLRETGVLVSDVSNQLPQGFFRVSIGTPGENDAFVHALAQQIREYGAALDSHARHFRSTSW